MKYLDWRDEFPSSAAFRPGDVFDFDGILGILTERFDIYADESRASPLKYKHNPSWAWKVEFFPSHAAPKGYNPRYGFAETNLYNIWKSKAVARGKKE